MQRSTPTPQAPRIEPIDRSLRIILWLALALAIGATAFLTWHAAHLAHHHVSRLALIIHCGLAACIGMLAITWIEQRVTHGRLHL
jgi:hypothetical protein